LFNYCPACAAPLADAMMENEARRACSAACGFVHYDNPTPVVAAVVEHEGCVVLAHNRAWPKRLEKFYGLITGFLERGESPAQCVIREVREELSLEAIEPTLIGVYPFAQMNQVIIAYHVFASGTVKLNHELDDCRHIPPERCRVWPGGTGLALHDWLRSRGYDPQVLTLNS